MEITNKISTHELLSEKIHGNGHIVDTVSQRTKSGFGWLPDYPDFRDYSSGNDVLSKLFKGTNLAAEASSLPSKVDLRQWCPPVEDQLSIGSCTANAGVSLMEYFERRAFGNHIDASRLFLYKATRNYMQVTGDTGAYLRNTMGAMVLFGLPPEKFWPYNIANFDAEPPAFCYSFASNYKSIKYFRLDPPGTSPNATLTNVKTKLAAGLPSMFGFSVYNSFYQAETTGKVPFPAQRGDAFAGGHAVVAVGYDDSITIKNALPGSGKTTGALLIRNSWGPVWGGMGGYLWMPYDFIKKGLAQDFWTLFSADYIDSKQFDI